MSIGVCPQRKDVVGVVVPAGGAYAVGDAALADGLLTGAVQVLARPDTTLQTVHVVDLEATAQAEWRLQKSLQANPSNSNDIVRRPVDPAKFDPNAVCFNLPFYRPGTAVFITDLVQFR